MKALEVSGLTKVFGDQSAVEDVSFAVDPGAIHALVGPNGSGKTTTLRMVVGLLHQDHGTIALYGEPASGNRPLGASVGYMPESPSFPGVMTAPELLDFYARFYGLSKRERHDSVESLLMSVGLKEWSSRRLASYTKGMKQRLGFAQALVGKPRLLVLDEPSAGLDPSGVVMLREMLRDCSREGISTLLSTHDLDEVERLCTHVTIMEGGRSLISGSVDDVCRQTGTSLLELELEENGENVVRGLRSLPFVESMRLEGRRAIMRLSTTEDVRAEVSRTVSSCGSTLVSLRPATGRMEDAFMHFAISKGHGTASIGETTSSRAHNGAEAEVRVVLQVLGETKVGGRLSYEIEIVNIGSAPVWISKIEEVVPQEVRVSDIPSRFDTERMSIPLDNLRVDPLQSTSLRLLLLAEEVGSYQFSPKVYYKQANGEERIHISDLVNVRVTNGDQGAFETDASAKVLGFLKDEFLRDFLDSNLGKDAAGWRSLVQISEGTGVSISSLYGRNGHAGRTVVELSKKGAIESRTFMNQRGRGGAATKVRINQEFGGLRQEIEKRQAKGGPR